MYRDLYTAVAGESWTIVGLELGSKENEMSASIWPGTLTTVPPRANAHKVTGYVWHEIYFEQETPWSCGDLWAFTRLSSIMDIHVHKYRHTFYILFYYIGARAKIWKQNDRRFHATSAQLVLILLTRIDQSHSWFWRNLNSERTDGRCHFA